MLPWFLFKLVDVSPVMCFHSLGLPDHMGAVCPDTALKAAQPAMRRERERESCQFDETFHYEGYRLDIMTGQGVASTSVQVFEMPAIFQVSSF